MLCSWSLPHSLYLMLLMCFNIWFIRVMLTDWVLNLDVLVNAITRSMGCAVIYNHISLCEPNLRIVMAISSDKDSETCLSLIWCDIYLTLRKIFQKLFFVGVSELGVSVHLLVTFKDAYFCVLTNFLIANNFCWE